jgi:hypothetical protein
MAIQSRSAEMNSSLVVSLPGSPPHSEWLHEVIAQGSQAGRWSSSIFPKDPGADVSNLTTVKYKAQEVLVKS